MSDSVRPYRRQPTRLPRPWDSLCKNTGVGCHFLLQCMKVKSESEVSQSCPTLSDPVDCSPPGSHLGVFKWQPTLVLLPGKIPWMEELGRLQSMGSPRAGHDWATSLSLFTFMHWRRKWQPTPVFLPGESQGWGSVVGCRLWGRTELDATEAT